VDQLEYLPHTDFDELQYEQTLNTGIGAVRSGDYEQARHLLVKASEMKPADALPWLWLSEVTEDPDEQRDYLERALAADPTNVAAQRGLVMLADGVDKDRLLKVGEGVPVWHPDEPEEANVLQAFICSQCGGRMEFDIQRQNVVCRSCGYVEFTEEEAAPVEAAEGVPAMDAHRLACSQCGAVSLLFPGQTASECPYCGSRKLIASDESVESVDPNMIGLARINEQQAVSRLRLWLGNGWFIPDDLKTLARTSRLRPAYYPFWAFDGTLQMKWVCQVNEGTSRDPLWVARQGVETEIFNDVMVPGLRNMDARALSQSEPFRLKELVEFKPEILAGWKTLTYNLPLEDAAVKAREKVTRKLRRELYSRVFLGYEKRDLRSGGVSFSELTSKLALLPVWVGTYRYRGKRYRLLINGQTGKVGGEKPIDSFKVVGLILIVLVTLAVFSLSVWALGLFLGWFNL
jgi:DNA-directed RNA polymerase subunit RPC12/RpoP